MAWLYKQAGSKKWWLGWRANGKQFRRSTQTEDRKEAEAQLRRQELIAQAAADGRLTTAFVESFTTKPALRSTLCAALDEWVSEAKGSTSPRTWEKYELLARDFKAYVNAGPEGPLLRDIDTDTVRGFLIKRRAKLSATSANQYRRILSTFFLRCIRNGLLTANPVLPVQRFKAGKDEERSRRAFTLEEVKTMAAKAPDDFWRYMILMGFYTGQRLGDLVCLRWGSVDLEQRIIRLTTAKTGRSLQIPMADPLHAMLSHVRRDASRARDMDYIWPSRAQTYVEHGSGRFSNEFYDLVLTPSGLTAERDYKGKGQERVGRAGKRKAPSVSFHCLRHTFVSMLKLAGGSQAVVKELAGHTSDLVSDHYTHTGTDAMAAAIRQLPPIHPTETTSTSSQA